MSRKLSTKNGNDSMALSVKIDVKVVTISTAIKFYGRSPTYQSNPLDVSRAVRYRVWQTVVRTSFGKVLGEGTLGGRDYNCSVGIVLVKY